MTARIYGDTDPRPLWKLFDDYDIAGSEMLGYWVDRSPVKTDVEGIRSTAYLHEGHILVAIGSWSDREEQVPLLIDWDKLGLDKEGIRMYKPRIEGLQPYEELDPDRAVQVERQQGCVVVLENKNVKSTRRASH